MTCLTSLAENNLIVQGLILLDELKIFLVGRWESAGECQFSFSAMNRRIGRGAIGSRDICYRRRRRHWQGNCPLVRISENAAVIADRNDDRGNALQQELRKRNRQVLFLSTDIRNEDTVHRAIQRVVTQWGRLDVLCNNAGIEINRRANEFSSAEYDAMLDTNLRGTFLCSKYAYPHLLKPKGLHHKYGVCSGSSACEPNTAVYAATKAALLGLTRGMARDFAPAVRVNAVCPGATLTGMMDLIPGRST